MNACISVDHHKIHIDSGQLEKLTRPAPARLLLQVAFEWACIVLLMISGCHFANPLATILCMLLIATRQHALLVLMHEFAHYQLSRDHKWLNDMIGDFFTAFPFLVTIAGFRRNHLQHHQYVATDDDPIWMAWVNSEKYHFPKTRPRLLLEIIKHASGLYMVEEMRRFTGSTYMPSRASASMCIKQFAFSAVVVAVAVYFEFWLTLLLYWIVPLSTFLLAIHYVRSIGEHLGMHAPGIQGTRTIRAGWLERFLICPNAINFHADHHLFPAVPFFRLQRLHERLLKDEHFRDHAVITHGYWSGLVEEVTKT